MNRLTTLSILFILTVYNLAAQKNTIYGSIRDLESGEFLIGATVFVKEKNTGSYTNNYGFYSLTLPAGRHEISFSYVGYKNLIFPFDLKSDTIIDIKLQPDLTLLNEVVIIGENQSSVQSIQMGTHLLDIRKTKTLPAVAGEVDIIKNIQYFPGVQVSNEGTTNLSVRGGSFDQNLFLLDDAPVYNPSHALGFFSTFNPDAISSVKIYKTSFPSRYGGRLSSVVDIRMKEGNNQSYQINGGIGLIASRISLEGPIKKNKASFIVCGRYSYAGFVANNLGKLGQSLGLRSLRDFNDNNEINFYDINAKFNYKIKKDHLFLSTYIGHDHFYYSAIQNDATMDWGNQTGTLRWNHIFSSKLFSNTMLMYSKYDYSYILKDDVRNFRWSSVLQEYDFKADFDYYVNPSNLLKFGLAIEKHRFSPGKIEPRDSTSLTKPFELEGQKSLVNSIYISNEQKISNKLSISYGLRYSNFFLLGKSTVYIYSPGFNIIDTITYGNGELVQFYNGLEPRLDLRYSINENSSLKASYTYVKQYQHLVSNSSVGLPTDVWLPANKYIKPQFSNQYSIGYYSSFKDNYFEFHTELYYRKLGNIVDYRDNADLFLNPAIETQVLRGDGLSYGAEFFLEKKAGKFTGWISYTLSKTTRQINGINDGRPFHATFDKRHNLSVILAHKLSPSWTFSSNFKLTSGGYVTVPEGSFNYYGASFTYYSGRNSYKLPLYHRLDISFTYMNDGRKDKQWKSEWNFGIYNVYGKKNIFSLFIKQVDGDFSKSNAYKMYLYGIMPYFTYNIRF